MSLKPLLKGREKCLLALGPCELGSRGLRHPYTHHITFIQEENGAVAGVTQKSWRETDEGKGRLAKTFADDSADFFTRSLFHFQVCGIQTCHTKIVRCRHIPLCPPRPTAERCSRRPTPGSCTPFFLRVAAPRGRERVEFFPIDANDGSPLAAPLALRL